MGKMRMGECARFISYVTLLFNGISVSHSVYFVLDQTPADCFELTSNGYSQYFDATRMACVSCPELTQKTSADGLKCVCQDEYYLTKDNGGDIECSRCPVGMVTSFSGWECVACDASVNLTSSNGKCSSCSIQRNEITVERQLDGSWGNSPRRVCETCAAYTQPDADGKQCRRCSQLLSVLNSPQCNCPVGQEIGALCFKSPDDIVGTVQQLFQVNFGSSVFDSKFFKDNAQAAEAMCKYGNRTACQLLANLCVLILYNRGQAGSPNSCFLYLQLVSKSANSALIGSWPLGLPWLYYFEPTTQIMKDKGIPIQFTFPLSVLDLEASIYDVDGEFLGFQSVSGGLLQLCKNSEKYLDAAFVFGTRYSQKCLIPVKDFWDSNKYPVKFYELWLPFKQNNIKERYAIPVLINNYADPNGKLVNNDKNMEDNWQFVRRFFLVDNISGRPSSASNIATLSGSSGNSQAVRYAKNIKLHVKLQPNQNDGLINPPYLEINYDSATYDDFQNGRNVTVSFEVIYSMDLSKHERDMAIAVGVLSAFAGILSVIQIWGWLRRSGKIAIDFPTLIKFMLFVCGNLANAFFVTTLGASIWWLIFYKRQNNAYLIVSDENTAQFIAFLLTAFFLKLTQLIHIIIQQTMINIFLIDWERPNIRQSAPQKTSSKEEISPSIWRTYFVANEWNEIQTTRKISPVAQYMISVFLLFALGFGNIATIDPRSDLQLSVDFDQYHAPMSSMLRFGIIGIVYLLLALLQWIFFTFIYERFFEDAIRQFIDLCSTCNVSVFILDNYMFGYYIHGRSVHGRADVGLREMHISFLKEESDLCSKRGLEPDSDQQTFEMAIPRKLRSTYDKTIMPILMLQSGAKKTKNNAAIAGNTVVSLDSTKELSLDAYASLNRLLKAFIDHCFREADYIVKPKTLFESILDVEFETPTEQGIFYADNGHSFDSVLMYGHELTWIIFEVLLYAVIDLAFQNYFLDGAITYVIMEVILKEVRDGFGRKNLVRKTLIDKRFLI